MKAEAKALIEQLKLAPLPHEGGFFRQTWISPSQLPDGRGVGSAILFLLTDIAFSALHRLRTDEIWLFHAGDPVEHIQLIPGQPSPVIVRIGPYVLDGDAPQLVVRGGNWQGAHLVSPRDDGKNAARPTGWSLMSCVMAPGWDDRDFVLGYRKSLVEEYPLAEAQIRALTR